MPGAGLSYIVPGINGGIGNTNGSILRSDSFTAGAGDMLQFDFNYVTTDGAGFGMPLPAATLTPGGYRPTLPCWRQAIMFSSLA